MPPKIYRAFLLTAIFSLFGSFTGCTVAETASTPLAHSQSERPLVATLSFPKSYSGNALPFVSHEGPGAFDNALALNLPLKPIAEMRESISKFLGRPLIFLKDWSNDGEAHVTVITPPEYHNILSRYLTMEDIEAIAQTNQIQSADLVIQGIGSGRKLINGSIEETYFLIFESSKLRSIRQLIWEEYVSHGGNPSDWDPRHFYPHVTIGFTKQDLHEPDVLKDIKHSYDSRFNLRMIAH